MPNVFPLIEEALRDDPEKQGTFHVIPTFVHPQTKLENIRGYFSEILPDEVGCLKAFLPNRSVYENYSRDGNTLDDFARSVKGNARNYEQAKKGIGDIEKIAKEILKLKQG